MAINTRQLISPRTLAIVSGVLLILAVILWVVDYRAGLALLIGLAVAWILFLTVRWAARITMSMKVIFGLIVVVAVVVIVVLTLLGPAIGNVFSNIITLYPGCSLVVSELNVTVDGTHLASDSVEISGQVIESKGQEPARTIDIPPTTVKAEPRGFMLKEVTFNLADVLAQQITGDDSYCLARAKIGLELQNFPRGSFYQARAAKNIEQTSYLDTETIKWTAPDPDITFSYIPPGAGIMRPMVDLLYGAQSIDKLALGALGSLGTLVLGAVTEVIIGRFVRKPLEAMIDKKDKKAKKA